MRLAVMPYSCIIQKHVTQLRAFLVMALQRHECVQGYDEHCVGYVAWVQLVANMCASCEKKAGGQARKRMQDSLHIYLLILGKVNRLQVGSSCIG